MIDVDPEGMRRGHVVAGTTAICTVDGINGRLIYRGYDIRDLGEHASFEEVMYLLWNGDLPTRATLFESLPKFKTPYYDQLRKYLVHGQARPGVPMATRRRRMRHPRPGCSTRAKVATTRRWPSGISSKIPIGSRSCRLRRVGRKPWP